MHAEHRRQTWHQRHKADFTVGQRLADGTAKVIGSWPFIIGQTVLVAGWVALNLVAWFQHWDPYPFILLNLLFSVQAAYAAPIIMMSQNRQAERDRYQATADYETDTKAVAGIEQILTVLDRMETEKLDKLLELSEGS